MAEEKQPNPLSEEFLDKIRYFLQDHAPERISRNLRKLFFDYLLREYEMLPVDFDEWVADMYSIFDFLDILIEERKSIIKEA